jgi:hypothetical protein
MQQTAGFISSLVIKVAKDKTSSLLRHDSPLPSSGIHVGAK